jgi:hypothetical protein
VWWAGLVRTDGLKFLSAVQRFAILEGSALFTQQSGLIFSPDGRLLAMVEQGDKRNHFGVVRVWDVHSGSMIQEVTEGKRNGLQSTGYRGIFGIGSIATY